MRYSRSITCVIAAHCKSILACLDGIDVFSPLRVRWQENVNHVFQQVAFEKKNCVWREMVRYKLSLKLSCQISPEKYSGTFTNDTSIYVCVSN